MSSKSLKLQVVWDMIDKATAPLKKIQAASGHAGKALKETRDKLKELNAQQKQVGKFRELSAGLSEGSKKLKDAQKNANDLARQLKATQNPTKELTRDFERAVKEARTLGETHQQQRQKLQGLRDQLNAAGLNTRQLGQHEKELRTNIAATTRSLSDQEAKLKAVGDRMRRVAEAKSKYEKTMATRNQMAGKGMGMAAGGGAGLYGGARLIAPGLKFEESMSSVQALTRLKKDSAEFQELRAQARQLGADTSFSATEAAEAQGFLGMAGFNPKAILDAMPGMLDLSKAGRTDLGQTADIASNILTGFNLQSDQMGRLGDVLVGTFTRSNVNMEMLGETMKYVAPIASGLGVDLETAAAMTGKLGDAGLQGGQAGTALRAILSRLAAPPKAAADALKKLNIQTADAQGNLRPMIDILTELDTKTKGMGTRRIGLFKAIAGEEAASGLNILADKAGSGELGETVVTLRQSQGEAAANAKTMADNARGDIKELQSVWEDFQIEVFDSNQSPLRSLIRDIAEVIRSVNRWAKENPRATATLVKVVAVTFAVVAALGALTLAAAAVLGPLAIARYSMTVLGIKGGPLTTIIRGLGGAFMWVARGIMVAGRAMLANPIGLLITGIALAVFLVYRYWTPITQFFKDRWKDIKDAFSNGWVSLSALILNWSPMGLFYKAFAGVLRWFGVDMPAKFTDFGKDMIKGLITGLGLNVGEVKKTVIGLATSMERWIKDKLGIRSPSRVFAVLGDQTMQGLTVGISRSESGPLKAASGTAKRLAALTAGITIAGVGAPALAFDTRPPIAPRTAAPISVDSHDKYEIIIQATPGADAQALARAVAAELDRRDRAKAARLRSSLHDYD